jgi:hypothetical protein
MFDTARPPASRAGDLDHADLTEAQPVVNPDPVDCVDPTDCVDYADYADRADYARISGPGIDIFAIARLAYDPPVFASSPASAAPVEPAADAHADADADAPREFELGPAMTARAAARMPAGFDIATLLAILCPGAGDARAGDFALLDEAGLLDVVAALAHLNGYTAGVNHRALALLADLAPPLPLSGTGVPAAETPEEWGDLIRSNRSDTVAALTGVSPYLGALALTRSLALAPGGRLAATGLAVERGELHPSKADAIADEIEHVEDDQLAAQLEAAALPVARTLGLGRLRMAIRAEAAIAQPAAVELEHADARDRRIVTRPRDEGSGLASMEIVGPSAEVLTIYGALDTLSRRARLGHIPMAARDDSRAALRFDMLARIASGAVDLKDLPTDHGRRASIGVLIPLSTLLGLDDNPAQLTGPNWATTEIAASTARAIAADASSTWRRMVLDDVGQLLELGSTSYRPPAGLAAHVLARDRTCRFPGCARSRVDLDHTTPYGQAGATTCAMNLSGLCRRHHLLKTLQLWSYRRDPVTGGTIWTDRHGNIAVQPPSVYPRGTRVGRMLLLDLLEGTPLEDRGDPGSPGFDPESHTRSASDSTDSTNSPDDGAHVAVDPEDPHGETAAAEGPAAEPTDWSAQTDQTDRTDQTDQSVGLLPQLREPRIPRNPAMRKTMARLRPQDVQLPSGKTPATDREFPDFGEIPPAPAR